MRNSHAHYRQLVYLLKTARLYRLSFITIHNIPFMTLLTNANVLYIFSDKKGPVYFKYSVIQKDGLNFVRLYFVNYTRHVNDLRNI
jgi:hypothetical protein